MFNLRELTHASAKSHKIQRELTHVDFKSA